SDVLKMVSEREGEIGLVKMDCEGCEYSLLTMKPEEISMARSYIIEVHGSAMPVADKFARCGYKVRAKRLLPPSLPPLLHLIIAVSY
ncbi:MAG: hypothetical protein ACP5KV_07860, partial [Candidatus Methanomethylicaceae archaeon]